MTARVLAAALALGFPCLGAAAAAQEVTGTAVGPAGQPLQGVTVVLHRVGTAGGALVATDTTDPAGTFRFVLEAGDPAMYFAALRYEGGLYVGPAIRGGDADPAPVIDYELRVGPSSEIGAVGAALSGGRPPAPAADIGPPGGASDAAALWLAGLLALSAAGAFVIIAPRYRWRRTRQAVMELAGLENRLARASSDSEADGRRRLEQRRDRLREQLLPRS